MASMATSRPVEPRAVASLRVSIIINNYNYGDFLRAAIDSALNQSYANTEVIVVDDGSTDNSREIIAGYANRITPVLKQNGGQGSALNAGMDVSHGDVVIFLDSDDMLLPHVVTEVVEAFQRDPRTAKVQYRLELIDSEGNPMGIHTPAADLALPSGDLRGYMLRFPDDVRTPPTSGNAFAASTLRHIAPVPETAFGGTTGADLYLTNLAPLFGPVQTLSEVGGRYRVHGSNNHYTADLSLDRIREVIGRTRVNHDYIQYYADKLNLPHRPRDSSDILSVTYVINRLASFKLEPDLHPIAGDSTRGLLVRGIRASVRRFDLSARTRLMYVLWFCAAAAAPRSGTRWLVTKAFYPERRGVLSKLVGT